MKFSVFLAVLLLLIVFVLSLLVLEGIQRNQRVSFERYFARQAETANVYLLQSVLAESNKAPEAYLASKGERFAEQLALISGQPVVLYDRQGAVIGPRGPSRLSDGMRQTLEIALGNKTAYWRERDSLYYLTPLSIGDEQVGVVQFYYSMADNHAFYNEIRQLFVYIGAGVFVLSFALAYVYFNSFANAIIRLNRMVDSVREGRYETKRLRRKDEMGTLSEGIHTMSLQISGHIREMEEEQAKLKLAVRKLSLLDEQQKQFIGSVTHEFKTPLTSVKAYLDLLEMYPDDPELLEKAKTSIRGETERLGELVDRVLRLSALEKYDFEYRPEKLDVRQVVLSVLDGLQGKMDKFGIELRTDLTEAFVMADRDIVILVLQNLLDNAIKYNKPGGRIRIRNERKDGLVLVDIADTGIGIPEEAARRIYEPFFTVDRNRSRQTGGVGLGLSLARKYAETQGGSVALMNTGPDGSTFRLTLPAGESSKQLFTIRSDPAAHSETIS